MSSAIDPTLNSTWYLDMRKKGIYYVGVGACALVIDLLTFAILFNDKLLLRRSAVITGIAIANCSVSLHMFSTGAFRVVNLRYLADTVSAYTCVGVVFPLLYPFSFVSQGAFVLIGGLERVLSVNAPMWCHKHWTNSKAWKTVLVVYGLVTAFTLIGAGLSFVQPPVTWTCGPGGIFGKDYLLICQLSSATGGGVGALLTLCALFTGIHKFRKLPLLSGDSGRLRKQLQLTKPMVFLSMVDLGLVVVPNIIGAIGTTHPNMVFPTFIRGSNANFTFCASATATFIALNAFSAQFRRSAVKLLRLEKVMAVISACCTSKKQNQVHP